MNPGSAGKLRFGMHWRYLLGTATEAEADVIEEGLLANDDEFNRLQETERLLIDDYVRHRLPAEESRLFEANYAVNKSRQARIIEARRQYEVIRRRRRFYAGGIAAAVTLAVAAGVTTIQRSQPGWRGADIRPHSGPVQIVFYQPDGQRAAPGVRGNLDAGSRAGLRPGQTLVIPCDRDRPAPSVGLLRIVSVAADGLSSDVVVDRWKPIAGCWTGSGQIPVQASEPAPDRK